MGNIKKIEIFDSTLRDGAQTKGVSFSIKEKIEVIKVLDDLGIDFIEIGNPSFNPKDFRLCECLSTLKLKNSKMVAFGSTRKKDIKIEEDAYIQKLIDANMEYVSIVGKASLIHVEKILNTTSENNLKMVFDTIEYLNRHSIKTLFDAEHFFDGYKENKDYAMQVIDTAVRAGAYRIILCDTNGGTMQVEMEEILQSVLERYPQVPFGVHLHNDCELAVANSLIAADVGIKQIQGTMNGIGERCGNTNLCSVIGNLQIKKDYQCIADENLNKLTDCANKVAELSHATPTGREAYVGKCAFSHKGGMHIDAMLKDSTSFEHIEPQKVGNERRYLISEVVGKSGVMARVEQIAPKVENSMKGVMEVTKKIKDMENKGYHYEDATSSVDLIILKAFGLYQSYFKIDSYEICGVEASKVEVKLRVVVKEKSIHEVSVRAEDSTTAIFKALQQSLKGDFYQLATLKLNQYEINLLDNQSIRVCLHLSDDKSGWKTVGVHKNEIEAILIAIQDAFDIKLNINEMWKGEENS